MNHASNAVKRRKQSTAGTATTPIVLDSAPVINLFNQAAEVGTQPVEDTKPKTKTITFSDTDYPGIKAAIKNVVNMRGAKKLIENKLKQNEAKVQLAVRDKYIKTYMSEGNPGSFIAKPLTGSNELLVVPKNVYANVTKERADELTAEYGPAIVTKSVSYIFNPDMIRQYIDKINAAINATDIPQADKLALIQKVTSYSITDNTINELERFGDKAQDAFYDIKPVFQLNT